MTSVRAQAGTGAGGWIEIPVLADEAERDRWSGAVIDAVARAHGDRFDPEAGPAIRRVITQVAAEREESDLLVVCFLPTARPVVATARVRIMPPASAEQLQNEGFALSPIHAAGVGHGMLATRTFEESVDGERLVAHEVLFLFVDGDLGIVVHVETTAALVFHRMQAGLLEIVGSLVIEYDDGRMFAGERATQLPGADADFDTWNIGTHVSS